MKDARLALLWHVLESLLVVAVVGLVWSIKNRDALTSRELANKPR